MLNATSRTAIQVCALSICSLPFSVSLALADNLEISGNAEASVIYQDVAPEESPNRSLTTLKIEPRVNAYYESRTLKGLWSGNVTHLNRDRQDYTRTDTYAEYQYSAQWAAIDRLLSFQANGSLNYRNGNAENFLVSDFLTNPDSLTKVRSNKISSTLSMTQGDWVRASGVAAFSEIESERSQTSNLALDSNTISSQGTLRNGDKAKLFIWELNGSYADTDRTGNNSGNFISRRGSGYIDTMLLSDVGIRLTASHEANQISALNTSFSNKREFNSYGAGLTYRQSDNRYIALTLNKGDSAIEEDDDDDTFVGVDLAWAFSSRSSIKANYGKRFYGDSGSVSINYNTRHFRSALSYKEEVTSTSRLLANPETLGIFVCPIGSGSIANCFQPSSLDYTPQSGEQLVQFVSQNFAFDDNIILRKSTNFQAGYTYSKISFSFNWRYALNDYLDQNRTRRTYSAGINAAWQLGSYTKLTSDFGYANIEQRSETAQNGVTDNWNYGVGLTHQVGRYLSTNVKLSVLDKSGDLGVGGGRFGNNYTDRRISFGVNYRFE